MTKKYVNNKKCINCELITNDANKMINLTKYDGLNKRNIIKYVSKHADTCYMQGE